MFRIKSKPQYQYYIKYLKRKAREFQTKRLFFFYKHYRTHSSQLTTSFEKLYNTFLIFNHRKRQQHLTLGSFTALKTLTLSTGQILAQYGNFGKFFKRSPACIPGLALQLKKTQKTYLKNLFLVNIKNFNRKQATLFDKLFSLTSYKILYFVHRKSFIGQPKKKHRIARSVLRNLYKQND